MRQFTELQTRILEALGTYKLLTPSQLEKVGVSKSRQVIWRELRKISDHPVTSRSIVGTIRFSVRMRMEHVESFYFLTPKGARLLNELHDHAGSNVSIEHLRSPAIFHRDYWHRKHCIDFHIGLSQALEVSDLDLDIPTWDRYFDNANARGRFQAKTRVPTSSGVLIPDINFLIGDTSERQAIFCLEMTNGRDLKRVLNKIVTHADAIRDGALGNKYGLQQNHQTLFLFEHSSLFRSFCNRFPESCPAGLEDYFWCSTLANFADFPLSCWVRPADSYQQRNFITGVPHGS